MIRTQTLKFEKDEAHTVQIKGRPYRLASVELTDGDRLAKIVVGQAAATVLLQRGRHVVACSRSRGAGTVTAPGWWKFNLNLFAGVGGWEVHDEGLGQKTDGLELNDAAIATAQMAGHFIHKQDVTKYDLFSGHIYTGLKTSPPCGEFTVAGKGEGRALIQDICNTLPLVTSKGGTGIFRMRLINKDAALVLEPMRIILQAVESGRPFEWIAMEQVREVQPIWDAYAVELRKLGYSVATGVLNAEQYGVPQTRRWAILIASLTKEVSLPTPTHTKYRTGYVKVSGMPYTDDGMKPWVSMAEALGIKFPAPGAGLRSNYGTGGDASRRGYRFLHQPAPTVTRKYNRNKWMLDGQVHRAMTDRDAAIFQTFPADYLWQGNKTEVQLQIGNAIPPLLAKAILEQVI